MSMPDIVKNAINLYLLSRRKSCALIIISAFWGMLQLWQVKIYMYMSTINEHMPITYAENIQLNSDWLREMQLAGIPLHCIAQMNNSISSTSWFNP